MKAAWHHRWRSIRAGLSVLLAFALLVGQAVAGPVSGLSLSDCANCPGQTRIVASSANASCDNPAQPRGQSGTMHGVASCTANSCLMPPSWVATTTPSPVSALPRKLAYRPGFATTHEGLGVSPAHRPPRQLA